MNLVSQISTAHRHPNTGIVPPWLNPSSDPRNTGIVQPDLLGDNTGVVQPDLRGRNTGVVQPDLQTGVALLRV